MVCSRNSESFRDCVNKFAEVAKQDVGKGTEFFVAYVNKSLGGNFDLAVSNVGEALFEKVIGCEEAITSEEAKKHPNVREAIALAREKTTTSCAPAF